MKSMLRWAPLALFFCAAVSAPPWGCAGGGVSRERARLTKQFVACLPDSLGDDHRREVAALLETFWSRAEKGEVLPEDAEEVTKILRGYVDAGRISGPDLVYFMAQVGYFTYRKDPRYNLPEGVVDHPILNPNSALIQLSPDSTGQIRMYWLKPGSGADTTKTPPRAPRGGE